MRAHFGLPSVRSGAKPLVFHMTAFSSPRLTLTSRRTEQPALNRRAPISVAFEIPYFTISGIQVRYLKVVEKSGYQALPWVRYVTKNGDDYRSVEIPSCGNAELIENSLRTARENGGEAMAPL